MNAKAPIAAFLGILAAALAVSALGGESKANASADGAAGKCRIPKGNEQVRLNPADFTTRIDNPYWPIKPGSR